MTTTAPDTILATPVVDTLSETEIPSLHAGSIPSPSMEELPSYRNMGFFQEDSLLHPEVGFRQTGFEGIPRAYQLWRDDWIILLTLLCFFFLVVVLKRMRAGITAQIKNFFFPSKTSEDKLCHSIGWLDAVMWVLLLSMMGGLAMFIYVQRCLPQFSCVMRPYILIPLYIAIWVLYFLMKNFSYGFVNWIFFDKQARRMWRYSCFCLIMAESVLFFPIIVITVFFGCPSQVSLWMVLFVWGLTKILLLYKTFQIFFPKIYGTLHLFVYFCTLELMPLLVVFKVMIRVTEELMVKL
jgi:hypothetical protein